GDARPRRQRGLEGLHRRQACPPPPRRRRGSGRGIAALVRGFAQILSSGTRHAHRPPRRPARAQSCALRRARYEGPAAGLLGDPRVHHGGEPRRPRGAGAIGGRRWDRRSTSSGRSFPRGCSAPRSASSSPCSRDGSSSWSVWTPTLAPGRSSIPPSRFSSPSSSPWRCSGSSGMAPRNGLEDPGARRLAGRLLGGLIVAGAAVAVVVTLLQWSTRPQTDDATVRANFVGIAPQVSGHIVDLRVRDNQQVHEGDLLFVVDPRPYEIAVARARAALALTGKEVDGLRKGVSTADAGVARATGQLTASAADVVRREADPVAADAEIARLEAQRVASEAALQRAKAELRHAEDHLARLEPLLPEKFVTEDRVDDARTKRVSAAMTAEQARTSVLAADAALNEARARKQAAVATLEATRAQHLATEAALRQSKSERARAEDAVGQVANINARVA